MRELLAELTQALDAGRDCVYCSILETRGSTPQKAGAAMLVFADGSQCGTLGGGCVEAEVKQRSLRTLGGAAAQPEVLTFNLDDNYGWDDGLICGGRMTILADPLAAADDREAYASAQRFPTAQRRIVGDIGASLEKLRAGSIDPSVYCLIMTRGHAHDEEALYHLATTPAGYVGMIGSKRKIKMIFEDLVAKGVPAEALAKVHAPLGLAIGSQTVPEIAVSIVAELIACRNLGGTIREAREWVPVEGGRP